MVIRRDRGWVLGFQDGYWVDRCKRQKTDLSQCLSLLVHNSKIIAQKVVHNNNRSAPRS